jgi:hypothetical protein
MHSYACCIKILHVVFEVIIPNSDTFPSLADSCRPAAFGSPEQGANRL